MDKDYDDDDDGHDVERDTGSDTDSVLTFEPRKRGKVSRWLTKELDERMELLQKKITFPGSGVQPGRMQYSSFEPVSSSSTTHMNPPARPVHYGDVSGNLYRTPSTAFPPKSQFTPQSFQQRPKSYWGSGKKNEKKLNKIKITCIYFEVFFQTQRSRETTGFIVRTPGPSISWT